MAFANFYDRIYGAIGMHVAVTREALARTLAGTVVGVDCAPAMHRNEAMIAEMAVNLIARLYSRMVAAKSDILISKHSRSSYGPTADRSS